MTSINYDDFTKVDMRIGKIIAVEDFPKAKKPAYKLKIDFGDLGIKQSSAQITHRYSKEDLLNRLIVAVVNFPKKQIADFQSEVLVLGTELDEGVVGLLEPHKESTLGSKIF